MVARVLTTTMTTTVEVVEEIEGFKAPQRIRRREQNHYFLCHLTGVVLCCCCSEEFDDDDRNEQIIPHHQFSNRCCGRFSFSLSSRFLLNESWSDTNCRLKSGETIQGWKDFSKLGLALSKRSSRTAAVFKYEKLWVILTICDKHRFCHILLP